MHYKGKLTLENHNENKEKMHCSIESLNVNDLIDSESFEISRLDDASVIDGKVVLVTGAAGSIGAEITRALMMFRPSRIIALDFAETPMFYLKMNLQKDERYSKQNIDFVLADIRDAKFINHLFEKYKPSLIYHAAAYKHVPLMEESPYEASYVNVFGTKNLVDAAIANGVEKFMMISTDKAINPTSVMGATKRLAEIYVQSRRTRTTRFISVRFGNVLNSNGSVLPIFMEQIKNGGPLTVTSKEMTRFFMTIKDAAGLVIESTRIGTSGDMFMFKIDRPLKIYDLAKRLLKLTNSDGIEIKEIGIRKGEKIYEEFPCNDENCEVTENKKILRVSVPKFDEKKVDGFMKDFWTEVQSFDKFRIVSKLKEMIPEYVSNNSEFTNLDKRVR